MGAKDLPEKDGHRSPAFVAKAHRILKGREVVKCRESDILIAKLQIARIAVDTAKRKTARLQRWADQALNEYTQAQARGDDLLRELYRLEGNS